MSNAQPIEGAITHTHERARTKRLQADAAMRVGVGQTIVIERASMRDGHEDFIVGVS